MSTFVQNFDEDDFLSAVKQGLISRDTKIKLEAVYSLITYLKSNTAHSGVADRLLDADITEFLGEALGTQDSTLLVNVCTCLGLLSKSPKFATQNRGAYIVECLLRTVHFLLLQTDSNLSSSINQVLILLATFIESFSHYLNLVQLFGNESNISQILKLISSIFKKEQLCKETMVNACLVLHSLLYQNDASLMSPALLKELPDIIKSSLLSLAVVHRSEKLNEFSIKIMILMSKIGAASLRFCQTLHNFIAAVQGNVDNSDLVQQEVPVEELTNAQNSIISYVSACIYDICLPFILMKNLEVPSLELCYEVLYCLKQFYHLDDMDKIKFSCDLAAIGFTVLLPLVSDWASDRHFSELKTLINDVLLEYLFFLSVHNLNIDQWPGGTGAFRQLLLQGGRAVPVRFSHWLDMLSLSGISDACKHFIIVFFYFFTLFLPSLPSKELQLSPVISYLSQISALYRCPSPIFKAFWFLYIMAILSRTHLPPVQPLICSMDILMKMLDRKPISELYTHHPSVLFWSFSSPVIPVKLQFQVMSLWLERENNGNYDFVIIDLIFANQDVAFCLLDVLKYSDKLVSAHASVVLSKAIIKEKEKAGESISRLLWDNLPHVLAQYCSGSSQIQGHNIVHFMQAATTCMPSSANYSTLLRSGNLVMAILEKQASADSQLAIEQRGPAIQLSLYFLVYSMKKKDLRVLLSFLSQPELLLLLYKTSGYGSSRLTVPSLQLLTHLALFQQEIKASHLQTIYTLNIDALHMLYLLVQKNYDVLICALHLLYIILSCQLPRPVFRLVSAGLEYISSPFIETLFRHLQNICSKNIPHMLRGCFKTMGAVLQYASLQHPDKSLYGRLATQPWTHVVLRILFLRNHPDLSFELFFFLCWWLNFYIKENQSQTKTHAPNVRFVRFKNRAPFPDLLSETAASISRVLLSSNYCEEEQTKTLALTVMHRILLLDTFIPDNLLEQLRKRLNQEGYYEAPAEAYKYCNSKC